MKFISVATVLFIVWHSVSVPESLEPQQYRSENFRSRIVCVHCMVFERHSTIQTLALDPRKTSCSGMKRDKS